MTTDDRDDIEQQSSPSSFKVGEVDRLSGFFTPVWESKRRLRAESPIPTSSAAASAPSSARDAGSEPAGGSVEPAPDAAARRPSTPPPRQATLQGPFTAAAPPRASRPPIKGRSISPAPARLGSSSPPREPARALAASPAPESAAAGEPVATLAPGAALGRATPAPEAAPSAGDEPSLELTGPGELSVRPVIPMPQTPGRTPPRAKASSAPPAANAGASRRPLEPALEREPELRASPPTSAPPARPSWKGTEARAERAAGVAPVLHDKLRSKPVESVDTLARHRETESEREALQRAAVRAAATPPDPYPGHLLRTLRRTLHLSMPLPESVRAMIDKYRY